MFITGASHYKTLTIHKNPFKIFTPLSLKILEKPLLELALTLLQLLEEQDSPPQGNEGPSGEEVITLGDEGDEGDEDDEQDFPSHLHLTPGQGTEVKETDEDATSNGLVRDQLWSGFGYVVE